MFRLLLASAVGLLARTSGTAADLSPFRAGLPEASVMALLGVALSALGVPLLQFRFPLRESAALLAP